MQFGKLSEPYWRMLIESGTNYSYQSRLENPNCGSLSADRQVCASSVDLCEIKKTDTEKHRDITELHRENLTLDSHYSP
jgi:hypothetical protein